MDIQVGDKITFRYKDRFKESDSKIGFISKIHSSGKFSVKRESGMALQFRADGTHANYEILSIEKGVKEKAAIAIVDAQDEFVSEHQKTRELIALSSLLLRLVSTGEAKNDITYDYVIAIDNKDDAILIDHCTEGFTYRLLSTPNEFSKPLKNVSMLRSLIMYGEES